MARTNRKTVKRHKHRISKADKKKYGEAIKKRDEIRDLFMQLPADMSMKYVFEFVQQEYDKMPDKKEADESADEVAKRLLVATMVSAKADIEKRIWAVMSGHINSALFLYASLIAGLPQDEFDSVKNVIKAEIDELKTDKKRKAVAQDAAYQ